MAVSYEEAIQQIKDRIDIVEIISEEVILKKSGNRYIGLCPFHAEKTPSFHVDPQKGFFHCFGCGAGGDAITFLMKIKNLDYPQTIRFLADKFNIELPERNGKTGVSKELKTQMMEACKKASEFFSQELNDLNEIHSIKQYLKNRGITQEVILKYNLGLAPKEPDSLYKKLKKEYSDEILEKAGLIMKSMQGRYYDRFRNRLTIPIQDENGNFVAFGARAIEDGQNPKYLNSPDSLIYNKSRLLYGLFTAKEAIKEEDSVVIMEGYFDVISAQANGIKNVVASCGTSLTSEHIKLIAKYSKSRKIYLSFDTDNAGIKATKRGGTIIKEAFKGIGNVKQFDEAHLSSNEDKYSCEIRVVAPPNGKDPDEFIRNGGAEEFKQIIKNAPLLIDFELNEALKHWDSFASPVEKAKYINNLIIPILKEVQNNVIQAEYVKIAAQKLNVDEQALMKDVQSTLNEEFFKPTLILKNVTNSSTIEEKTQKNILSLYLINDSPLNFSQICEKIKDVEFEDEKLIIVKNTIDKLIGSVNNVRELIEALYAEFNQDEETKAIITELVTISEPFNNLSREDFEQIIAESIEKLNKLKKEQDRIKTKALYMQVNDDEMESLKMQMQLRDKINKKFGENNT